MTERPTCAAMLLVPAWLLSSCAAGLEQGEAADAVNRVYRMACTPDRVRVLRTRQLGPDTIHVIEACGERLEVEQGLELPRLRRDLLEAGADYGVDDVGEKKAPVPAQQVDVVRQKAQRWCRLGAPPASEHDEIAFYSATAAEQQRCRTQVAASIVPLEREQDALGEVRLHFAMGRYRFVVTDGFHVPACEHLRLEDTAEACRCRAGASAECAAKAEARRADAPALAEGEVPPRFGRPSFKPQFYARSDLGFGQMRHGAGGLNDFESATFESSVTAGALVARHWYVGGAFGGIYALSSDAVYFTREGYTQLGQPFYEEVTTSLRPALFGLWLDAGFFPFGEDARGPSLAGLVGFVVLGRGDQLATTGGPLLGGALGYDTFSTFLGLRLRVSYAPTGEYRTLNGSLSASFRY